MTKTGAVERRGSRHRLHYEVQCPDCKRAKWVREDTLPAVCADCAGAQGRKNSTPEDLRTGKWYVRMIGSAHTLTQWACGDPEAPCWTGGSRVQFILNEPRDVPATDAKAFGTKAEACDWIVRRGEYLVSRDRFPGQYAAVKF